MNIKTIASAVLAAVVLCAAPAFADGKMNLNTATEQELSKLGVRYVAVDLTQNPSTFEQIKNAGFKQIPVVISPNFSWSGHRPDLIHQLAQSIAA